MNKREHRKNNRMKYNEELRYHQDTPFNHITSELEPSILSKDPLYNLPESIECYIDTPSNRFATELEPSLLSPREDYIYSSPEPSPCHTDTSCNRFAAELEPPVLSKNLTCSLPESTQSSYIRELLEYWYEQICSEREQEASVLHGLMQHNEVNHVAFCFDKEKLTGDMFVGKKTIRFLETEINWKLLTLQERKEEFSIIIKDCYELVREYQDECPNTFTLIYESDSITGWMMVEEIHYDKHDSSSSTLHLVNDSGEIVFSRGSLSIEEDEEECVKCAGFQNLSDVLEENSFVRTMDDKVQKVSNGLRKLDLRNSDSNVEKRPYSIPNLFDWLLNDKKMMLVEKCKNSKNNFKGKKDLYLRSLCVEGEMNYMLEEELNDKLEEELKKEHEHMFIFEYVQKGGKPVKTFLAFKWSINGFFITSFGSVLKADYRDIYKNDDVDRRFYLKDQKDLKMFIEGYKTLQIHRNAGNLKVLYCWEKSDVPKIVCELRTIKNPLQDGVHSSVCDSDEDEVDSSPNEPSEPFTGPLQDGTVDSSQNVPLKPITDPLEYEISEFETDTFDISGSPKELTEEEVRNLVESMFGIFRDEPQMEDADSQASVQELDLSDLVQERENDSQRSTLGFLSSDLVQESENDSQASTQELISSDLVQESENDSQTSTQELVSSDKKQKGKSYKQEFAQGFDFSESAVPKDLFENYIGVSKDTVVKFCEDMKQELESSEKFLEAKEVFQKVLNQEYDKLKEKPKKITREVKKPRKHRPYKSSMIASSVLIRTLPPTDIVNRNSSLHEL